jgi:hypothetical protein
MLPRNSALDRCLDEALARIPATNYPPEYALRESDRLLHDAEKAIYEEDADRALALVSVAGGWARLYQSMASDR